MRLILAILVTAGLAAAQPASVVLNGDFATGTRDWVVPGGVAATASVIAADLEGQEKALRIVLKPDPGGMPWSITMHQTVNAFVDEGDELVLSLWLRSPDGGKVSCYVEKASEPHTKYVGRVVELTQDWEQYEFAGAAPTALSPGDAHVVFHLAHGEATIDMTGIRLVNANATGEARGERPTMDDPVSMISNGDFSQSFDGNWGRGDGVKLKTEVIDADVGAYSKAVRLHSDPPEKARPWDVQFGQPCQAYVHPGDSVYFQAWLRSPDNCQVTFIYELATDPHTKYISRTVHLTPEWTEYRFMGRPDRGFRPGESQAKFFLGSSKGVVEVAGVRVANHGVSPDSAFDQTIDYWGGREHPDTWRAPALERIEKIRKGDLSIRVLAANGKPVPGAKVQVKQKRHAFRFGTALPAARLVDSTDPDNVRFQQEVERLFNVATFENDLKWPSESPSRLKTVDAAVKWLQARDIAVRGHCLLWGSYKHVHRTQRDIRGEELHQACKDHVFDYARRMNDSLYLWDVVNEAGSNTELWDEIGWEAFADSFRWAREANPNVELCYNDYGIVSENPAHRAKVSKRVQYLLDQGAPVDVLGIQAHMGVPLTPIHRVLEIMDEWAQFGLPLEVTELDLGCWDDEVHADYLRDFMIAAFSHPKIQSIIMWGFWEGSHWRSKVGGAMFSRDWTKRPAQEAWEALVLADWWTDLETTATDDGVATGRAFYGSHEISATWGELSGTAEIGLLPGGNNAFDVTVK